MDIYNIGTLVLAARREWIAHREERRARPVVICYEDEKRALDPFEGWTAEIHLANDSTVSAYKVSFGVQIRGRCVAWTHDPTSDSKATRVRGLRSEARHPPEPNTNTLVVPEDVLWAAGFLDHDVDEGRLYWAEYQDAGGSWWRT